MQRRKLTRNYVMDKYEEGISWKESQLNIHCLIVGCKEK